MIVQSMSQASLDQPDWKREIHAPLPNLAPNGVVHPVETVRVLSSVERPDGWDPTVDFDLQSFWKVENDGTSEGDGVHDPDPLANYSKESILRLPDGTFQAELPFRKERNLLRPNFEMSSGRLQSLLCRLRRTPDIMEQYHQQIMENIEAGYVEEAHMSSNDVRLTFRIILSFDQKRLRQRCDQCSTAPPRRKLGQASMKCFIPDPTSRRICYPF